MTKINKEPSITFDQTLKKLQQIVDWFESQEQVDIEIGLEKAKEGVELIKQGKSRLKNLENEFTEIKKKLNAIESN